MLLKDLDKLLRSSQEQLPTTPVSNLKKSSPIFTLRPENQTTGVSMSQMEKLKMLLKLEFMMLGKLNHGLSN